MLASELDDTTTTTTTTTLAASTTTIMQVTTTTTIDPGPDVSDVLRIAYDELLEYDSVSYVAYSEISGGPDGSSRFAQVGRWTTGDASELRQYLTPLEGAPLADLIAGGETVEMAQTRLDGLGGDALLHRFPQDDLWWSISPNAAAPVWTGRPDELAGPDLERWADTATFLDALFTSIEAVGDPSEDSSGNLHYPLELDVGLVVPVLVDTGDVEAFRIGGWEVPEDLETTGSIVLSDGVLIGAIVDTGPWWRGAWESTGTARNEASATWAATIGPADGGDPLTAPCPAPTTAFDEFYAVDVLICPA